MADIWLQTFLSLVNWVHLFATASWMGGMIINILVLLPSTREALDAAIAGKFLAAVMRRFRRLVYGSIVLLVFSGIAMSGLNKNYLGIGQFNTPWTQIILVKHVLVVALILLAVYSFEVLAPKVARVAAKGPSRELASLQRLQLRMAGLGFVLGLIILLLTGAATAISALA